MTDLLTERQQQILIGLVEEYVQSAKPQSSAGLKRQLSLDASTATIRNILHELEDLGYIVQPYTSSGRIPTDVGYRFYVNALRAGRLEDREIQQMAKAYSRLKDQHQHLARATAKLLAGLTNSVAISGENSERVVAGLPQFLEQPEGSNLETVKEVSSMIEAIDESINEESLNSDQPVVYIGDEISFADAPHVSLMAQKIRTQDGREVSVIIMGPKRMAYRKNINLLSALNEIL